MKGVIRVVT